MDTIARILVADDEPALIEDYHCALAQPESAGPSLRLVELQDELFGPQRDTGSLSNDELVTVNQGEAAEQIDASRSEERRVGKEGVSKCRCRQSPTNYNQKKSDTNKSNQRLVQVDYMNTTAM